MKEKITLERLDISAGIGPDGNNEIDVRECIANLDLVESAVLTGTLHLLECEIARDTQKKGRFRKECDDCFGEFNSYILEPYVNAGLASRAAAFLEKTLIPAILELETKESYEFHKGALFYNTALTYLLCGDEARFEFYLAMTDEEDYRTHGVEGKPRTRGTHNKKEGQLSSQTIQPLVQFAVGLANGTMLSVACPLSSLLASPATEATFDTWRHRLDIFHHGEIFRSLNELRLFCGIGGPNYPAVLDNPTVMLRLNKVLAHIAQWAESQLTLHYTGTVVAKTLAPKLEHDRQLSALVAVAGVDAAGDRRYPGKNMPAATLDNEMRYLLADIKAQKVPDERAWRVLRILYLVRNSTAHQIEPSLACYSDRQYLLDLIQVTFVAALIIQHRKGIAVA